MIVDQFYKLNILYEKTLLLKNEDFYLSLKLIAATFNFIIYLMFFLSVIVVFIYTNISRNLPEYRDIYEKQSSSVTRYFSEDGFVIHEEYEQYRLYINQQDIPEILKQAFISAEDKNFYTHNGIDLIGIFRAVGQNLYNYFFLRDKNRLIGASTITQQLVKNLILDNERTITRKVKEIILANKVENFLSKNEILEIYLNEIYLGRGAYGVAAASERYFNKSLNELDIEDFAFLAALPKAPSNYEPSSNYESIKERRDWVLDRMADNNFITNALAQIIQQYPIEYVEKDNYRKGIILDSFLVDNIKDEAISKLGPNISSKDRLYHHTSINYEATEYLKSSINAYLKKYEDLIDGSKEIGIEVLSVSPITGRKIIDFNYLNKIPHEINLSIDSYNDLLRPLYFAGLLNSNLQLNTKVLARDSSNSSISKIITLRKLFNFNNNFLPKEYFQNANAFVNKYLSLEEFLYKQIIVDDKNEVNMNLDQVLSIFMPVTNIGEVHETHYIDKVNDRRGGVIYRATNSNKKIMNENVAFKIKSLLCSFDNESVSEDRKFFLSRDCSFQSKTKDSTFLMIFSADLIVGILLTGDQFLEEENFLSEFQENIIYPLINIIQEEELKDFLIPANVRLIEINKDTGNMFGLGNRNVLEFF